MGDDVEADDAEGALAELGEVAGQLDGLLARQDALVARARARGATWAQVSPARWA